MTARALAAEFVGTFTFVFVVCGAGLFAAPTAGTTVVALAAGLAILVMAFAIGHVSGGHFNPAVTLGLVAGGRFEAANAIPYLVAQVCGGLAAMAALAALIGAGPTAPVQTAPLARIVNTAGGTGNLTVPVVLLIEAILSALLLVVIMGATSKRAAAMFAPVAIGLAYAAFYLVALPVSNASLNPARSTAAAVFAGGRALADLWLFWVAPILGAVIGGVASRWLQNE